MRRLWSTLIPPLLCGLLADLCLVLLALRPPRTFAEFLLILFTVVAAIAIAAGWEVVRWWKQRGSVELVSIQHQGTDYRTFLVPLSPHPMIGVLLLSMLVVGIAVLVLIFTTVHRTPSSDSARMPAGIGLGLGAGMFGVCLWWLLTGPRGLALLPHGVLLRMDGIGCFFPWETIEEVSPFRLPLFLVRKPLHLGFRVTGMERIEASSKIRKLMAMWDKVFGWHFLCPTVGITLSAEQLAQIVQAYLLHPEERRKIGTQPELEEIRASLALTRPSTAQ